MKMRILKDCTMLDAWKKNPRGYVVLKVTPTTKIEAVYAGKRIPLVRVSPNADRAARQLGDAVGLDRHVPYDQRYPQPSRASRAAWPMTGRFIV